MSEGLESLVEVSNRGRSPIASFSPCCAAPPLATDLSIAVHDLKVVVRAFWQTVGSDEVDEKILLAVRQQLRPAEKDQRLAAKD